MKIEKKPRRDRNRCLHHFVSSFDGHHACGMWLEFSGGMRVHMTGECKGVCGDYREIDEKKKGGVK